MQRRFSVRHYNGYPIPYDELDENIIGLVKSLNEFDGLQTTGSCGGHKDKPGENEEGHWMISFRIDHSRAGFLCLEFLTWLFNSELPMSGHEVRLSLNSFDPSSNEPFEAIYFFVEGVNSDPDDIAKSVTGMKATVFDGYFEACAEEF
jgi:hypothetical protein